MTIRKGRKWWKGTEAADIEAFLQDYTEAEYPADKFVHAVCDCGNQAFRLMVDSEQGCALRICGVCGKKHFICDSKEYWEEANVSECACPCGTEQFEIAVGFSHVETATTEGKKRKGRAIKWITVGARCVECGILGVYADWKIDYEPSKQLYRKV